MNRKSDASQGVDISNTLYILSPTVKEHATNPRNVGQIPNADGYGSAVGHCGDDMEIWLRVTNGNITDTKFWTNGCFATIATGSAVTEIIKGKSIRDIQTITIQDVLDFLDGLPEDHEHCATLAVNTVKEAIKEYWVLKRDPWRKAYRPQ